MNSENSTLEMWNMALPHYPLTADLLLNPSPAFIMGAALEIFTLLGMNKENILYGPLEEDEHTIYYADLIPIINVSRVLNHIMSPFISHFRITIFTIMSPTTKNTQAIFKFLGNISLFMVSRLDAMEPRVQEIYDHKKSVEVMEDEHSNLRNQLNEVAVSKASRGSRLKKLEEEQHKLNLELREQTEINDELKKIYQSQAIENEDLHVNIDQINSQTDVVLMEKSRLQAQIVNDADEIKYRYEQAILEERDTIEQRDQLQEKLLAKEITVKNLQSVKEKLEETKNLLDEITALAAQLKEIERGDSKDGDMAKQLSLEQLEKEVSEYYEQLEAGREKNRQWEEQCEQDKQAKKSELEEAQMSRNKNEMKYREAVTLSVESEKLGQALQGATHTHEQERVTLMELLKQHDQHFNNEIIAFEDEIKSAVKSAVNEISDKVKAFNNAFNPSSRDNLINTD